MKTRLGALALECFLDLGITLVYAVLVGFLIVGIVATDDAPVSLLSASLYAAALPGSALALIVAEVVLRAFREARDAHRSRPSAARCPEPRRSAYRLADYRLADHRSSLRASSGRTLAR